MTTPTNANAVAPTVPCDLCGAPVGPGDHAQRTVTGVVCRACATLHDLNANRAYGPATERWRTGHQGEEQP